jgi:phospholipid/cholesterol/gamma-HCH transport system substrate-binding protein
MCETLPDVNLATANLADDTEALKHEFLFRGFFKKRGFYSLSELTPEEYRADSLFQNARNERFWLGPESFTQDQNGTQLLSSEGQAQIDRTVGSAKDEITDRPIVVEGYSTDSLTSLGLCSFFPRQLCGDDAGLRSLLIPLRDQLK